MKKIRLILLSGILLLSYAAKSQCPGAETCERLLQGGLYSFTQMTNTGSFSQDLRTYFLSEQFQSDLKNGKWGGSLTVPIKDIPISLGANSSEEKIKEFQGKILSETNLSVKESFYQTMFSSIPNTNLYAAFNECIETICGNKVGFLPVTEVITEDYVVFNISYKQQVAGDPMPKVTYFNIENAIKVNNAPKIGDVLPNSIIVTARRDLEKDLILTLQTDRGPVNRKVDAEGAISNSKETPIGTVVISLLPFDQFNYASKNNTKSPGELWTAQKSKWAPCDGRSISNSGYAKITSKNFAPDLRGMFLRGLNTFDPVNGPVARNTTELDPESRVVGQYQGDLVGTHGHGWTGTSGNGNPSRSTDYIPTDPTNRGDAYVRTPRYNYSESGIGSETRPKNVSVYYYIKIN